jgi:glycerol kinase
MWIHTPYHRVRMTRLLAIDQGTTSTRAIVFDGEGRPLGRGQVELPQHFPGPGRVEHDPEEIWRDTVAVVDSALADADVTTADLDGVGITNQRETVILWDRATGEPVHRAIVWQDRRTAEHCERLVAEGREAAIRERTGLVPDPYFSATKLAWMLENVPGARRHAEAGELAFGTVDCFLLWRLTGGRVHATDATNASRTMLFDIRRQEWDEELLRQFGVPREVLPEVRDSAGDFGATEDGVPITGIAGDQQAAAVGQVCFAPGDVKSTYGTGCFVLLNTGCERWRAASSSPAPRSSGSGTACGCSPPPRTPRPSPARRIRRRRSSSSPPSSAWGRPGGMPARGAGSSA